MRAICTRDRSGAGRAGPTPIKVYRSVLCAICPYSPVSRLTSSLGLGPFYVRKVALTSYDISASRTEDLANNASGAPVCGRLILESRMWVHMR